MIQFNNVSKYFNDKCILNHVSLTLPDNGLVIIQGESGSGKSTILNMIASIEPLTSGSIEMNGRSTYILSSYDFIDALNVLENITLKPGRKVRKRIVSLIDYLGITPLMQRKVSECSDGQRQRIGIARALANEQEIILCDEPSEFLDCENRELVIELLQHYAQDHLVIIVSHDKDIIQLQNATVYELANGQLTLVRQCTSTKEIKKRRKNRIDSHWIIGKVMKKSRLIINALLIFVMVGLFILLAIYQKNLVNPKSFDAQIVDTCFYYKDNEVTNYTNVGERIIPSFDNVSVDGSIIRILPLPLQMEQPQQVVINQNCHALGLALGKMIRLNYTIFNNPYYLEFNVTDIYEETDIKGCQIYYNLDSAINLLDQDIHLNLTGNEESSWYTMQDKHGLKLYQATIGYDNIQHQYDIASNEGVEIFQPLFTQRYTFDQNAQVYRFVFWVSLGLLLVLLCYALIMLNVKEFHSLLKTLSILTIYSSNVTAIKKCYAFNKFVDILIIIMSVVLMDGLLSFGFSVELTYPLLVLYVGLLALVALLEVALIVYYYQKMKISSISRYLKN